MKETNMTQKDRKDIYERVTERMIEKLETGTVPWRQPWRSGGADGMPCNANSKRPYRGFNLVVTLFSGYDSPYWATFKGWKKLGGSVRKGEKGTLVVGWKSVEREEQVEEDGVTRTKTRRHLIGFGYTVFNERQVDGATIPKRKADLVEHDPIAEGEELLARWQENECEIKNGMGRAYYQPQSDYVGMPPLNSFHSPELYYKTAYHELTHATGAEHRLARFSADDHASMFEPESYSKEELTAEMGAAFLAAFTGMEAATEESSAAYIEGWLAKLRADKKFLISAASKAQAAADYILNAGQDEVEAPEAEVAVA